MSAFLSLVKKELKSIKKEKTIMFAILIQFCVASFSSAMLVGVMSFYDPSSIGENTSARITIGVVGDIESPVARFAAEKKNIDIVPYGDSKWAERYFKSGRIDAVMFIPESTDGVLDMKLVLPELDSQSTLILMLLDKPLKEAENFLREENGIRLNYDDLDAEPATNYEFLYSVILPLLMFFPALIAGSIVIDTVSEEIENKTLDTIWSAPISLNQIFTSKITAAIITACIQCIIWVVLLRLNSFSIQNLGLVIILAIMIATAISFGAGLIGLYFKDRERAQFVYSMVLLGVSGLSYMHNPSPFSLITRLATGNHYVGAPDIAFYLLPLAAIIAIFFFSSKKLLLTQS